MPAIKKYLLECLGTFVLVFIICSTLIFQELSKVPVSNFLAATIFGVTISLLILAIGGATGAHLNPAFTLCCCIDGTFRWKDFIPYFFAQLAGAFGACAILRAIFPRSETLGTVLQLKDDVPAFLQETWLSLLFLVASLSYRRDTRHNRIRSAAVTGATVLFVAWISGPFEGTGMNPARALAPAVLSGETAGLWIFLVAPVCGAFAAAGLQGIYDMVRSKKPAR